MSMIDPGCKAVPEETGLSHVSGISGHVYGIIPTIADFLKNNSLTLIKPAN